jgi:hypothetical protein
MVIARISLIVAICSLIVTVTPTLVKWYVYSFHETGVEISIRTNDVIYQISHSRESYSIPWKNLRSDNLEYLREFDRQPPEDKLMEQPSLKYPTFTIAHPEKGNVFVERIELVTGENWPIRDELSSSYDFERDTSHGIRFFTESFVLGPESGETRPIPFSPKEGECELQIKIHAKVPAEALGFPEYFDNFKIKPISGKVNIEAGREPTETPALNG